jgi:hypothetical protein
MPNSPRVGFFLTHASFQNPSSLQESDHHDNYDYCQNQVNQVAAKGNDERTQQPEEKQKKDDRFERVTWHIADLQMS